MKYVNFSKNEEIKTLIENRKKPKRKGKSRILVLISVFLLLGVFSYLLFGNSVKALFNPVYIVSNIKTADLKESDGRTNVLVLGSDKRSIGNEAAILTDTILVASIGRVENDVLLISLPRDLWVKTPSGYYTKINGVYSISGVEELRTVVEEVMGIPIHYYGVVDFKLFQETIDALGGIEVDVERTFTDNYFPVEGKEAASFEERYQTIHFEQGTQMMTGEEALKYVRSRHGDNGEDTDFARSARQQRVISAIKKKALSVETLLSPTRVNSLYETYQSNIDTDVTFGDMQNFYLLSQQVNFDSMRSVVLDDRSAANEGGLLIHPEDDTLYGGAYVLIPQTGDYSQIHAYVQKYIFGN